MNSKTLKVTGTVVLSCLVMIVIVIYTPKPTSTPNRSKKILEERLKRFRQEGAYIRKRAPTSQSGTCCL